MTLYETLALYEKGPQAWNAWAQNMRDQRQELIDAGGWNETNKNQASQRWSTDATADFRYHSFGKLAQFQGFEFPGTALFTAATFEGIARFDGVTFEGDARFGGAVFEHKAVFHHANFDKDADFEGATFGYTAFFEDVSFQGEAWFSKVALNGDSGFEGTVFKDNSYFHSATFKGKANFENVAFERYALFSSTTFENISVFQYAAFRDYVEFVDVTFERGAHFNDASFEGKAQFGRSNFNGYTAFGGANFMGAADFNAIRSTSAFSLARLTFWVVPNFEQAHFDEAPRLDHLKIEPEFAVWAKFRNRLFDYRKHGLLYQDFDWPAHWCSLKRLAVQAHDHAREQDFFRREMIARRFIEDQPWHAVFWTGVLYQILSDFGRSIFRPLFCLSISTAIFAGFYLDAHLDDEQHVSGLSWYIERTGEVIGIGSAPELSCIAGPGSPQSAALHLSLSKTLLLPAIGSGESLNTTYACLYGVDTARPQPPDQLIPPFRVRSPESVIALSMLQSLISAVLLFLLLLAIRNHFRIK